MKHSVPDIRGGMTADFQMTNVLRSVITAMFNLDHVKEHYQMTYEAVSHSYILLSGFTGFTIYNRSFFVQICAKV